MRTWHSSMWSARYAFAYLALLYVKCQVGICVPGTTLCEVPGRHMRTWHSSMWSARYAYAYLALLYVKCQEVLRPAGDLEKWNTLVNPIARFKKYLIKQNFWSEQDETDWMKKAKEDVLAAFAKASKAKFPSIDNLFSDVYKKETKNLKRQKEELYEHLSAFGDNYPINQHLK
ncbi:unnamed protein product [Toxocara canis]|uniref:2-oxoisovalerate dehydrogenase subunit alpha n=1 Tax=Toxocara canis TaxID=6265 RepID=A0A183UI16_TOXCA|nr:unnamed protein product [Toxocara canis]